MRILILTVTDPQNGCRYFDISLANGLSCAHNLVTVRAQTGAGDIEWIKPKLVIFRLHPSLIDATDWGAIKKAKRGGALIGAWLNAWLPTKLQVSYEQKNLHTENLLDKLDLIDFGLSWWGKEGIDAFFTPWTQKYGKPIIQVQPAGDTSLYGPYHAVSESYQLGFIGSNTTTKLHVRDWLEPALRRHTHWVAGRNWHGGKFNEIEVEPEDERKWYCQTAVLPNLHIDACWKIPGMAVDQRLFQLAACGVFQVVDNHPRIGEFFDEDELVVVKSKAEFDEAIDWWFPRRKARKEIAKRARQRVLAEHTFFHRASALMEEVKKLG